MYAMSAMKQYQQVGVQAQVNDADPHRLIQMLMQGGLDRIAQAKGRDGARGLRREGRTDRQGTGHRGWAA